MIDPLDITKHNRTDEQLEEFLIFCVLVANKNSDRMAKALDEILALVPDEHTSPFDKLRTLDSRDLLLPALVNAGTGEYRRRLITLRELIYGWASYPEALRHCSPDDLETIYGIGPKTARFFVIHTRPNQRYAAIDTHILKYLRDMGYNAPVKVPRTPHQYKRLEQWFLDEYDHTCSLSVAEFDLAIWTLYSGRKVA